MDERSLIYDWNTIEYNLTVIQTTIPTVFGLMMKHYEMAFRASARNPTIEQKIELLDYMEKLGIKVDLGLPGAGPFHAEHIDAMLTHITENDYQIRPRPQFAP